MGYDAQFPWAPGQAPVPSIALIGSEAPGRVAWAIAQGADAHLLKPIGSSGVYAALVIAFEAFATRAALADELAGLRGRLEQRQVVAEAVAVLMLETGSGSGAAYALLRRRAMDAQLTIEDMAARIAGRAGRTHVGDRA
jgi:AmiR/NasT family two-component response regulator